MLLLGVVRRPPEFTPLFNSDLKIKLSSLEKLSIFTYCPITDDLNSLSIEWSISGAGNPPFGKHLRDFIPQTQHVKGMTKCKIRNSPFFLDLVITGEHLQICLIRYLPLLGKSDYQVARCRWSSFFPDSRITRSFNSNNFVSTKAMLQSKMDIAEHGIL